MSVWRRQGVMNSQSLLSQMHLNVFWIHMHIPTYTHTGKHIYKYSFFVVKFVSQTSCKCIFASNHVQIHNYDR